MWRLKIRFCQLDGLETWFINKEVSWRGLILFTMWVGTVCISEWRNISCTKLQVSTEFWEFVTWVKKFSPKLESVVSVVSKSCPPRLSFTISLPGVLGPTLVTFLLGLVGLIYLDPLASSFGGSFFCEWCLSHTSLTHILLSLPFLDKFHSNPARADWKHVAAASWRKYPHPRSDIISVDILRKEYDQEAGILKVRRFIISQPSLPFPSWFPQVCVNNVHLFILKLPARIYFVEDSIINVKEKTYSLNSINLGITRSLLKSNETCLYTPHPANPKWYPSIFFLLVLISRTVLNQRAETASPVWVVGSHIEQFFCDHTVPNVTKVRALLVVELIFP